MLTIGQAFYDLKDRLSALYDDREAAAITHEILNHITGMDKSHRLLQKEDALTSAQLSQYEDAKAGLVSGKPLQYIIGSSWFMGREFAVNKSVLIPRPETEELVLWVINDYAGRHENINILDIGTGSGCIPVSLKLAMQQAHVMGCDISADALIVAATNARNLSADIRLVKIDFLDAAQRKELGMYDVIVSNPPYIPLLEKERIHTNVKDHEPHIALFVPDNDPLVFYRAIASFAKEHLHSKGYIYCELDADHAAATQDMFESEGYRDVVLQKDVHGNLRMLRAAKN